MTTKRILIAAVSENGCIGNDGKMPWHYSEDLKRFKKLTTGHVIVMGRKTFESLGKKALPDRTNLILTRNWSSSLLKLGDGNTIFCKSYRDALVYNSTKPHFIIGGSQVYKEALEDDLFGPQEILLTFVKKHVDGDAFFPQWPILDSKWVITQREPGIDSPEIEYITYRRRDDNRHSSQ